MATRLNRAALDHARELIGKSRIVRDERDDWSEHAPSADDENAYIDRHGWAEFALWHLGEDPDASEETKQRYTFPYGDFARVHRCAVIALESRAAQNDHDEIARAAKMLFDELDGD